MATRKKATRKTSKRREQRAEAGEAKQPQPRPSEWEQYQESLARHARPVTFTFTTYVDDAVSDEVIDSWRDTGEIFSRLLASDDAPEFRKTLAAVFARELLDNSNLTDPARPDVMRFLYAPVMCDLAMSIPATAEGVEKSLLCMRDVLANDAAERAIAEVNNPARQRARRIARGLTKAAAEGGNSGEIAEAFVALSELTGVYETHPDLIGATFLVMHAEAERRLSDESAPETARANLREWLETAAKLAGVK